jgi:hypothetical protein
VPFLAATGCFYAVSGLFRVCFGSVSGLFRVCFGSVSGLFMAVLELFRTVFGFLGAHFGVVSMLKRYGPVYNCYWLF